LDSKAIFQIVHCLKEWMVPNCLRDPATGGADDRAFCTGHLRECFPRTSSAICLIAAHKEGTLLFGETAEVQDAPIKRRVGLWRLLSLLYHSTPSLH
jgi:hypothetical protein